MAQIFIINPQYYFYISTRIHDPLIMVRNFYILLLATLALLWHAKATTTIQQTKKVKVKSRKLEGKGKGKGKGSSAPVTKNTGILIGDPTSTMDLQIVSCNSTSVTIQGVGSGNVTKGTILVHVGDPSDIESCSLCSPLFRKVLSVSISSSGMKTLKTTFATMGEIFDKTILNQTFSSQFLEPLSGCSHSGVTSSNYVMPSEGSTMNQLQFLEGKLSTTPIPVFTSIAPTSTCDSSWQVKNGDGRCTYTNCFVGTTGDPANCFECTNSCSNGCGAADSQFLKFDGNFLLFDFGRACCNHDFCWSSSFYTMSQCNSAFLADMLLQCPPFSNGLKIPLPVKLPVGSKAPCGIIALAFYLAVNSPIGQAAYKIAQDRQKNHEMENVCIAKCPTTQESGGQGNTTLTIDMLKTSGTFPVTYQMYSIPDQLYIVYEGKRIFDTGGLVSGSQSIDVTFSGKSTIIQANIYAPTFGTAWDVFLGCPI